MSKNIFSRSLDVFFNWKIILVIILQFILLFSSLLIVTNYSPAIIESATTLLIHSDYIETDVPDISEIANSIDSQAMDAAYSTMIDNLVLASIYLLLVYLLLNGLIWAIIHNIVNNKSIIKIFFGFILTTLVYMIPILLILLYLFMSDINLVAYIVMAVLLLFCLFLLFLTYANLSRRFYFDILYMLKDLKKIIITFVNFIGWSLFYTSIFYLILYTINVDFLGSFIMIKTVIFTIFFSLILAYFRVLFIKGGPLYKD